MLYPALEQPACAEPAAAAAAAAADGVPVCLAQPVSQTALLALPVDGVIVEGGSSSDGGGGLSAAPGPLLPREYEPRI